MQKDNTTGYNAQTFEEASKSLIKWLNENANPHAIVTVDVTSATLFTGEIHTRADEYLKD